MKFYLLPIAILLLTTPAFVFADSSQTCESIFAFRSGEMPYGGNISDQIDFIIENVTENQNGAIVNIAKYTTRIRGTKAAIVRYKHVESSCLSEDIVMNHNNKSYSFHMTSDISQYRKMKQKMRTLLKDPWGEELLLRRI